MRATLASIARESPTWVCQSTGSPWGAVHGAPVGRSDAESRDPMLLTTSGEVEDEPTELALEIGFSKCCR
jgi:hypothetical protein